MLPKTETFLYVLYFKTKKLMNMAKYLKLMSVWLDGSWLTNSLGKLDSVLQTGHLPLSLS